MAPTPTSRSAGISLDGAAPPRSLPSRLGRYTLFDFIGRGGMADLYLARSRSELGAARLCVVKEVRAELAADEHFSALLAAEAKLAARLAHPNIVAVHELGREQGRLFLAMEYVEGLDLRELLRLCSRRKIGLPIAYAMQVVTDVLRALDHAHRLRDEQGELCGIVHRDVSPSNVLLSFDGEVKLCDFGIASATHGDQLPSPTVEGKAGYMSPEQARGEPIDVRCDVFAAGVVLWELLAGRRMYRPGPDERLIDLARRGEVPPLAPRGLPAESRLHAIVSKALAADRAERYASAGELLAELTVWGERVRAQLSPMRFGRWLSEHFADEKLALRRARERVAAALEHGPAVVMTPRPSGVEPLAAPPAATAGGPEAVSSAASAVMPAESAEAATSGAGRASTGTPSVESPTAEDERASSAESATSAAGRASGDAASATAPSSGIAKRSSREQSAARAGASPAVTGGSDVRTAAVAALWAFAVASAALWLGALAVG